MPLSIAGRSVVIVDDGIATGSTARAAIQVARARGASRVVLASPVASAETARELRSEVDELVVVAAPQSFAAVGQFYEDFSATSDDEVASLLSTSPALPQSSRSPNGSEKGVDDELVITLADVRLHGHLRVPIGAQGTVLFAHGSGSSSRSPRNVFVAQRLYAAGIGTLLFDLLTAAEERDRSNVFDIELLSARLLDVTHWLRATRPEVCDSLGYFGASTGAAAALRAAADPAAEIKAVVSRGGRADLAFDALAAVRAPTLLIVGGEDRDVLRLNELAAEQLRCEHRIVVVPGATHLFEEPGALEKVAELAGAWFAHHLGSADARRQTL
jgi:putative phosphoribosyl transferase